MTIKLSTKTRYGLRALLYVAERYDGTEVVPVGEVAREQDVSEKYLEQLFLTLRRSGLLKSVRGVKGGYMLCRPPEEVTISDVVGALEGGISFADCHESDGCRNREICPTRGLWSRLKGSIDEILEDTTLADLLEEHAGAGLAEEEPDE